MEQQELKKQLNELSKAAFNFLMKESERADKKYIHVSTQKLSKIFPFLRLKILKIKTYNEFLKELKRLENKTSKLSAFDRKSVLKSYMLLENYIAEKLIEIKDKKLKIKK